MTTSNPIVGGTTLSTLSSSRGVLPSPGIQVLIPQHVPGPFYYPPCKCDLVNQIRYFNPKTRQFYYHTAYPWPDLNSDLDGTQATLPANVNSQRGEKTDFLIGEPETFHSQPNPYFTHNLVPVVDGSLMRGPFLHPGTNANQSPYSVPMVSTLHEPGICELILVFLVLLLWLYSFYRLYLVWQKTLNFSEASIQGPQGWDLVINWVMERIQIRNIKDIIRKSNSESSRIQSKIEDGSEEKEPNDQCSSKEEVVSDRNFLMDLDHIERCATPESEKSRSHLKLQLFRDYSVSDASKNSLASSPKSTRSKSYSHHQYSNPCSIRILHEDETCDRMPPAPLAAFGIQKMTATQIRRARMNKQMSEDCSQQVIHKMNLNLSDHRSLQKLSETCEMRDLSGRSIHDSTRKNNWLTKQHSIQYHKSDTEEV